MSVALEEIGAAQAAAHATNVFLEVKFPTSYGYMNLVYGIHWYLSIYEDCPTSTIPEMSITPFSLHIYNCAYRNNLNRRVR